MDSTCPKCGGPTEEWQQQGRVAPAIRCLKNGCTWFIPDPTVPKDEVHFQDTSGKLVGKIVGIDPEKP